MGTCTFGYTGIVVLLLAITAMTAKLEAAAIADQSLINLPQNDVFNNKVDIEPSSPIQDDDRIRELSKLSWQALENNNKDTYTPQKYKQKGKKIIQGPRGPAGPRGPPGAQVTADDLMKMFKKMVKQGAQERARKLIRAQCPDCEIEDTDSQVLSSFYPGVQDRVKTINRAPVAFTTQLLQDHTIEPNNTKQIKYFRLTGSEFGVIQGVKADIGMDGVFQVQKSGIYQFTATVNIRLRRRVDNSKVKNKYLEVKICPNNLCEVDAEHKNLIVPTYRHSLESRQKLFTVQFSTLLQLKKDDFVTLHISNFGQRILKVQEGSTLSGIMLSTS